MQKLLLTLGVCLLLLGAAWPWLTKLGLGRLPGDVVIEREGLRFYFPIVTCLLISAVISLLLWLLRR